jgi:hypothetical protein
MSCRPDRARQENHHGRSKQALQQDVKFHRHGAKKSKLAQFEGGCRRNQKKGARGNTASPDDGIAGQKCDRREKSACDRAPSQFETTYCDIYHYCPNPLFTNIELLPT